MRKEEILAALQDGHARLSAAIEGLSEEELQEPGLPGGWSVKDVLAHLSRWEAEVVKLLWQVRQGLRPTTLLNAPISDDEVNAGWQQEDRGRPLDRVLKDFRGVRQQTIRRVETFTDEELNDSKRFAWSEGKPLWEWIAGDSFEHDLEHLDTLLEWREKKKGVKRA